MLPNRAADRFSNRADDYAKYRPDYPPELLSALQRHGALTEESVVADIGSGTGILTRQIAPLCAYVYAIEPNRPMRKASLELLRELEQVVVLEGRAENSGLRAESVDLIIAAQAFHWFDIYWTYEEWGRVLRPEGRIALIWNERSVDADAFHQQYEQLLLDFGTDYRSVDHRRISEEQIKQFLEPETLITERMNNSQTLDFDGLKGRLLSSSYVPKESDPNFSEMLRRLQELFDLHSSQGAVTVRYETKLYLGRLIESLEEEESKDDG